MATRGFITLSRDFLSSSIWANAHDTSLFLYCLLQASHNRYRHLRPGEFNPSVAGMVRTLGWSRNCVRTHLRRLEAMNFISVRDSRFGRVYRIADWKRLCALDHEMTPEGHPATGAGQTASLQGSSADPDQKENQKDNPTCAESEVRAPWKEY